MDFDININDYDFTELIQILNSMTWRDYEKELEELRRELDELNGEVVAKQMAR